jgi:hypothetical protein
MIPSVLFPVVRYLGQKISSVHEGATWSGVTAVHLVVSYWFRVNRLFKHLTHYLGGIVLIEMCAHG